MISGSDGARVPGYETAWSRRYAANKTRLDSGELAEIAGVVRELSAIESGRGLSAAERRMLARARRMLGQGT